MSRLVVNTYHQKNHINKNIYGHFAEHLGRCIYDGIYVGENSGIANEKGMRSDVVAALREIQVPVLRWPGGNFADEYHWMDGIGPKDERSRTINTHWGGDVEDNSFGTHEFFELCRQIGCEPYINVNVGSGKVEEMQKWIEYMTFGGDSSLTRLRKENGQKNPWKLKYVGIGNENWLCGGNMTAGYYADVYKQFQTYVRSYGEEPVYKIACGPLDDDYEWTDILMKKAGNDLEAISLHYYTYPGVNIEGKKGESIKFGENEWYHTISQSLKMEELIRVHTGVMRRYDPEGRVDFIIDEWGNWYDPEPGTNPGFLFQQNTVRDAVTSAANLNIFNQYSDRISMTNIAQAVNVLQSVLLTDKDKLIKTPTYYVYDMFKFHQNSVLLDSYLETEEIGPETDRIVNMNHSVSMGDDGRINITIVNFSAETSYDIESEILGSQADTAEAFILHGEMNAHNTAQAPDYVKKVGFYDYKMTERGIDFRIPPRSVLLIRL
ncbi:alpha-N-arabinofuranosidase [Blautia producta]|uniref:alpha-N-arabinofuranosidase n=1 Tax=Blautia producta TaxID=33035 RepID=UPI0031B60A1F